MCVGTQLLHTPVPVTSKLSANDALANFRVPPLLKSSATVLGCSDLCGAYTPLLKKVVLSVELSVWLFGGVCMWEF